MSEYRPLWTMSTLTVEVERISAGLPADPRLVEAWQEARWAKHPKLLPGDPQTPQEAAVRTMDDLMGIPEEKGFCVFPRDGAGHLCIEGRQVKAALKEAANILKSVTPVNGKVIPLRSKLAERVFVAERLIPFSPETKEPDDEWERPIHVMTAQGPRDALKRSEVIVGRILICHLKVLNDGLVTHDMLDRLLTYAGQNGLGADRSQGYGLFTHTLTPT
ncbi:MAG: hypothetical protein M0Z46_20075 [Actinomycetota bacterium]|jgi:hypothetical protein|nr:hypothetical protein [Actinomycetota bacterium]